METTPLTPAHTDGHLFARERLGNNLILNSLTQLGSLHEPEIVQETAELLDLVETSRPKNLVIDLSQSDYLGTVMLSAVIRLWKRVAERGGELVLCNVSQKITQILQFTRLDTIWTVYGSRDQALRAIGG